MVSTVSYAFFRDKDSAYEKPECGDAQGKVFVNYLRLLVRAHFAVWSPFELRFYHDDRVTEFPYWKAMERMRDAGLLKLFYCGPSLALTKSMMWRLRPAFDPEVDYCIVRDVDSVPLPRDRRAVEEFIKSGRAVHVIHGETGSHSGIMGGTLGVHARRFRELIRCKTWDEMIAVGNFAEGERWEKHGGDQHHLARNLWPMFRNDMMLHELHHSTDVPCADTRSVISGPMPADILPIVAERGDSFSKIIGGCAGVDEPCAFYDSLPLKIMDVIRACERG